MTTCHTAQNKHKTKQQREVAANINTATKSIIVKITVSFWVIINIIIVVHTLDAAIIHATIKKINACDALIVNWNF